MTSQATTVTAFWRRWPWLVDVAPLALEIPVVLGLLGTGRHHGGDHVADPLDWIFAQALILPLVLRRRFPIEVFGLLVGVAAIQALTTGPSAADFALLIALYTVAAHRERRDAFVAAGVVEVGVFVAAIRFQPVGEDILASIVFLTGLVAAALFTGISLRARRDYLASLEDRAERLERERDQQAELAATAERTRIAREMHDVVAHSLSVVITLADGAVAAAATDPNGASAAMQQVGETGRQALAEMRRLLGVLRDERPAELAPQPDLDRLNSLLDDVRGTGLPVEFAVTGTPTTLPSTAQATVYRIVQESLTNVLKHAIDPTHACVALLWQPGELTVEVTDDGTGTVATSVPTGGHGLQGIGERVALYDGDLVSGPVPPHGWRVRACLHLDRAGRR